MSNSYLNIFDLFLANSAEAFKMAEKGNLNQCKESEIRSCGTLEQLFDAVNEESLPVRKLDYFNS